MPSGEFVASGGDSELSSKSPNFASQAALECEDGSWLELV